MINPLRPAIDLARRSVTGIMDFRYVPYALGDTFTWLVNLHVVAAEAEMETVEVIAITLPEQPSSPIQPGITSKNYIRHFNHLFPAFTCGPRVRAIHVYERPASVAMRVAAITLARGRSWPGIGSHLCRRLDVSTHRKINAFYAKRKKLPRLRAPRGYAEQTERFKSWAVDRQRYVVVNVRQRAEIDDPTAHAAAAHRDSRLDPWLALFDWAASARPDIMFVLVGGYSEWERTLARRSNVVIPRMHGCTLGHELTLLFGADLFLGSSSGFSAAATFSDVPYAITNFEHRSADYIQLPIGTEQYPFATGWQKLIWQPETTELLRTLLEEGIGSGRRAQCPQCES
jgi:hypothetical protein